MVDGTGRARARPFAALLLSAWPPRSGVDPIDLPAGPGSAASKRSSVMDASGYLAPSKRNSAVQDYALASNPDDYDSPHAAAAVPGAFVYLRAG